jgi:hypothetical protein
MHLIEPCWRNFAGTLSAFGASHHAGTLKMPAYRQTAVGGILNWGLAKSHIISRSPWHRKMGTIRRPNVHRVVTYW